MCGISGAYGVVDEALIKKMCGAMVHRGPDEAGYYLGEGTMLGMRRLSIIDLATGSQPVFNEDGTIAVVQNGEIYNYRENRRLLETRGHRFRTDSDTETIVHLYEEFGDGCVERLRGMFSFAIWDSRARRLIIARDRLGIKPLYYHDAGGVLLFASELKALLASPSVGRDVDPGALHDYLTYMCVPGPTTILRGVKKLDAGSILVYQDGKATITRYWDLCGRHAPSGDGGEAEAASRLTELLSESVRMHLVSDVPVGIFLSGGLDSGALVAYAAEALGGPLKTFSIGFDDPRYSELGNAALVARMYGTEHHEYVVDPSSRESVEEIIGYFDEPFADSSAIPTFYLSRFAREYVKVALSGDGGDELFGGYGNYKADRIGQAARVVPSLLRKAAVPAAMMALSGASDGRAGSARVRRLLDSFSMPRERAHVFWLSCFSSEAKRALYADEGLAALSGTDSLDRYTSLFAECGSEDFLNRCMHVDVKSVLLNDYLVKVDRMSMANSLEVRVPYLDHRLVEYAASLDSSYKVRGLGTKRLFRKMMAGRLPAEVVSGAKKGFSIPLVNWLREGFSSLVEEYLSERAIARRGYFNYPFVKRLKDDHASGAADNGKALWILICLEIWARRYLD